MIIVICSTLMFVNMVILLRSNLSKSRVFELKENNLPLTTSVARGNGG
jgi:hypothetical protein